jgi:recombination protein U
MKTYAGNRGKNFERDIQTSAQYHEIKGLGSWHAEENPVNITKVNKNVVQGFLKKGKVDFHGTIQGGRAIHFDAKETKVNRFRISDKEYVHEHQIEYLKLQHSLGAVAFFLVHFSEVKEYYVLPYTVFKEFYDHAQKLPARSRGKSMNIEVFRERPDIIRVKTTEGVLQIVEAVREWWNV